MIGNSNRFVTTHFAFRLTDMDYSDYEDEEDVVCVCSCAVSSSSQQQTSQQQSSTQHVFDQLFQLMKASSKEYNSSEDCYYDFDDTVEIVHYALPPDDEYPYGSMPLDFQIPAESLTLFLTSMQNQALFKLRLSHVSLHSEDQCQALTVSRNEGPSSIRFNAAQFVPRFWRMRCSTPRV